MAVPIQPLSDYVVAQAEEAESKTASGLYLPDAAKEKPKVAKILAVGKDVKDIKTGDRILYKDSYDVTDVKIEGAEYLVINKKNIIAIVIDPNDPKSYKPRVTLKQK